MNHFKKEFYSKEMVMHSMCFFEIDVKKNMKTVICTGN
jgi:hypothetical protein